MASVIELKGVSAGYGATKMAQLAIAYLIVGLVVIYIRGIVTERITSFMWKTAPAAESETSSEVSHAVAD